MSQENLAQLYRYGQAYSARDLDRCVSEFCAPDIEYHPAAEDPDAGTLRGRQAVKRFFEDWFEMFEGMRFETEDYIDVDDERVFVWTRWTGRGRASGADADWHMAHIYTMREGRIVRVEEYYDKAEALEALGCGSWAVTYRGPRFRDLARAGVGSARAPPQGYETGTGARESSGTRPAPPEADFTRLQGPL